MACSLPQSWPQRPQQHTPLASLLAEVMFTRAPVLVGKENVGARSPGLTPVFSEDQGRLHSHMTGSATACGARPTACKGGCPWRKLWPEGPPFSSSSPLPCTSPPFEAVPPALKDEAPKRRQVQIPPGAWDLPALHPNVLVVVTPASLPPCLRAGRPKSPHEGPSAQGQPEPEAHQHQA